MPPEISSSNERMSNEILRQVLASATCFAIPLRHRFRGTDCREGVILTGPGGWGEFAPFRNYTDAQCVPWLLAALEAATEEPAPARRTLIEVNTTVPVVDPQVAFDLVRHSGCQTAKVKVADAGVSVHADADRLAAVRAALGTQGAIRIDANGAWTPQQARQAIARLDEAADGLEYVEQPCATVAELAQVRGHVAVPIAADESIRTGADPLAVARAQAADIAVLKVAPLGGVRRALQIAQESGLDVVVSSAIDTSVGLAAGARLAAALPTLRYACGLGTGSLLTADVTSHRLLPIDGLLDVPDAVRPDLLADHVAANETCAYWLARLRRVVALMWPELRV